MRLTGFDAAAMIRVLRRGAPPPAASAGAPAPRRDAVTLALQALPELPEGTHRGIYSMAGAARRSAPTPPPAPRPAAMYGIEGLLAGRTLVERYRVDEVLARGGMGAVYRAHDLRLGREVALKVVTVAAADAQGHARLRARFHREARAAAGLHHPHVVAVFDFGTDPELQLDFLVMELLRGEDLATRVARRGAPDLPAALEVVHQAARGLAAGHRAGLIHRDVKPGNLFLETGDRTSDLHVKLLDFGIAEITADDQTVTHLTVSGRAPYSPAYASPEQLRGDVRLTPATDVFSLGAVAFQLVTGRRVFTALDPRQAVVEVSQSLASLPRLVPGLPASVRTVLQRALAPHPEDRFQDAGALAEAVAHARGRSLERPEWDPGLPAAAPPPHEEREARDQPWSSAPPSRDPPPHRSPDEISRLTAEVGAILQRGPGAYAGAPAHLRPAPPETSRFHRALTSLWNFGVTAASLALFAGCWFVVVSGLQSGDLELTYAGAAASVFLTPLMLHRLLGRRGSLRFAFLASFAASAASVYFLARTERLETTLVTMLAAQVTVSLAAEWLTYRPRRDTELLDP